MKNLLKTLLFALVLGPWSLAFGQSGFIGTTQTPTPAQLGITREIWITMRTDARTGRGTKADPYDGSTAAKFLAAMQAALGGDGLAATDSCVVNIGPGTFTWQGYCTNDNTHNSMANGKSYIIRGAGQGITTLKLSDNTLTSGGRTKAVMFYHDADWGLVDYFEVSDMTIDMNPSGNPLVAGGGVAFTGAIMVHCRRGYVHDLTITGVYADPAEQFPISLWASAWDAAYTGHYIFERITASCATTSDVDSLLMIGAFDSNWGGTRCRVTGAVRNCKVTGDGNAAAFGNVGADGWELTGNYATNVSWAYIADTRDNRNVTIANNHFAGCTVAGFRINGGDTAENFWLVNNRLSARQGSAVAFDLGTPKNLRQFANTWDNYTLSGANEANLSAGLVNTNQFLFSGGTNLAIKSGATITNLTSSGVLSVSDGTAGSPAITFSADTDTGFYRAANNSVSFASGGNSAVTLSGAGIALANVTSDRLLYTGAGNLVSAVTVGTGLSFSGGTLSATGGGGTTNSAAMVIGSGANHTCDAAYQRLNFGGTDCEVTLPEAGTYLVTALLDHVYTDSGWAKTFCGKFYNSTDAADVSNSERVQQFASNSGSSSHRGQLVLQNVITVAASKVIQIYVKDPDAASDTVVESTRTSISYVRLY